MHVWVHVDHKSIRVDVEGLCHINLYVSVLTNRGHVIKPVWNDTHKTNKTKCIFMFLPLGIFFLFCAVDFLWARFWILESKASGSSCDKLPHFKPPAYIITVADIIGANFIFPAYHIGKLSCHIYLKATCPNENTQALLFSALGFLFWWTSRLVLEAKFI